MCNLLILNHLINKIMENVIKKITDKYEIGDGLIDLTNEIITALYKNDKIVPCKHSGFNAIPDGSVLINGQPKVKIVRTPCGSWCADFSVREYYDGETKQLINRDVLICSGRLLQIPLTGERKKEESKSTLTK